MGLIRIKSRVSSIRNIFDWTDENHERLEQKSFSCCRESSRRATLSSKLACHNNSQCEYFKVEMNLKNILHAVDLWPPAKLISFPVAGFLRPS